MASRTSPDLSLLDFYPERGTYQPGQMVQFALECQSDTVLRVRMRLSISCGVEIINTLEHTALLKNGFNRIELNWQSTEDARMGYGAEVAVVRLPSEEHQEALYIQTAFDVLSDWTAFPRYGFLCDFSPDRKDAVLTIQTLAKYHINGLQFYDWQYRHDRLVPPQDDFIDPLGRQLSLNTIRELIDESHSHGMAAMPYLAVYAASAAFWRDHLDWALYDQSGQPIPFGEDFLGLMDPSDGSPWKQHLLEECRKVLTDLRFDGLHIDQYGEPRVVFDHAGHSVDLPKAFRDFIYSAVKLHPGKPVLFNAVANWPIETLASAPTAFNYIEIWPPDVHYPDLVRIVRNARRLSGGKPVVIALYIPARRMTQIRLADALIHSAGGGRIELGENERLLSDPYFPRHEALSDELRSNLRCTSDFWVRYEEWFSAPELEGGQDLVHAPEGIETFVRKVGANWAVSLVNLTGMNDCCWNEDHDGPQGVAFTLEAKLPCHVLRVWLASPDDGSPQARPAEFEYHGQTIRVKVSRLSIWNVLFFETERV